MTETTRLDIRLRIDFGSASSLGPGKVALLEHIEQERDDVFGIAYGFFPCIRSFFENKVGRIQTGRQARNFHVQLGL